MPISECSTCGGQIQWHWEEAFCKFGFMDGDGDVETDNVADTLREAGYDVITQEWGMHNTIITHIRKFELEQIPDEVKLGYDNPRAYLPKEIVELLDKEFPS